MKGNKHTPNVDSEKSLQKHSSWNSVWFSGERPPGPKELSIFTLKDQIEAVAFCPFILSVGNDKNMALKTMDSGVQKLHSRIHLTYLIIALIAMSHSRATSRQLRKDCRVQSKYSKTWCRNGNCTIGLYDPIQSNGLASETAKFSSAGEQILPLVNHANSLIGMREREKEKKMIKGPYLLRYLSPSLCPLHPWILFLVRRFQCGKIGDTHIELVAFPSVGKSVIFSNLPGVYLEVAACEFTTLTTLLTSTDTRHQFQHLDLQSIMEGIKNGKGRRLQDLT
eukprot:bmy_17425T0